MVAPPAFIMTPIANPFVGQWDISQVFQAEVKDGDVDHYFFAFYDNTQQHSIIQVGREDDIAYYTVPNYTCLRHVLQHLFPDAAGWRFTEACWARAGPPMPARNQVDDLLALSLMNDLKRVDNASSFDLIMRRDEVQA